MFLDEKHTREKILVDQDPELKKELEGII